MKNLISKLRESTKLNKTLYILIVLLTFSYAFSIPAFSNQERSIHYIAYVPMILLGITVVVYSLLYSKLHFRWQILIIPIFALLSIIGTTFYSHEYRSFLRLILLSLSFIIFYFAFDTINNKKIVISLIAIAISLFAVYFIYKYRNELINFRNYTRDDFRLGSYFDNPNGVAAACVVGFSSSFYSLLYLKSKWKYLFLISLLLMMLVGFSTGSRTFLVMILVFLVIMLFIKFKRHKLLFLILLSLIVIALIALLNLPFLSTLKFRIITAFTTFFGEADKVDTSSLSRVAWMQYGFDLGYRNLIFGYGANGFGIASGLYTYSHNNFSEVFCNFGLIGFISFYLPLILIIVKCVKNRFRNSSVIIPYSIYYFVVSFSNVFYYNKLYYLVIALLYVLTFKNEEADRKVEKIVFLCDGMSSGGAERTIATLANTFVNNGIYVSILGISTDVKDSFYELDKKVEYSIFNRNNGNRIKTLKRIHLIRKYLKEKKPDLVISFLPHVNVYTTFAIINLNIPHVVSERNNPNTDPKGFLLRILKKYSFSTSDGAVFQTKMAREYYGYFVRKRSKIISNPVIVNSNLSVTQKEKKKRILYVGRLTQQKNVFLLIDAFCVFSERNQDFKLVIYGDGPIKDELELYATSKGVSDNVIFMGNSITWKDDEIDDAMFVLSSDYEGMPNSLMEALALQIPCISTDCPSGGPRELIINGQNGFLCKVGDYKQMSELMEKCLELDIIKRFENANKNLKNVFSPQTISSEWINYLNFVLNNFVNE